MYVTVRCSAVHHCLTCQGTAHKEADAGRVPRLVQGRFGSINYTTGDGTPSARHAYLLTSLCGSLFIALGNCTNALLSSTRSHSSRKVPCFFGCLVMNLVGCLTVDKTVTWSIKHIPWQLIYLFIFRVKRMGRLPAISSYSDGRDDGRVNKRNCRRSRILFGKRKGRRSRWVGRKWRQGDLMFSRFRQKNVVCWKCHCHALFQLEDIAFLTSKT